MWHRQTREETMLRKLLIAVAAGAAVATAALAQGQFGSAAEAKAMLEKAVAELKSNEAAALAKFNKGEGGFKDRDLYVFCYDMTTVKFTAHVNQALLGTDVKAIKEKDGSPLGEKVFNATKPGTIATVSYNFPKPGTTDPVPKESYVTQIGNQGCGVGYYK
jgi:cytochrome c